MNLISIIVPIYNSARYLIKCLDNLINQTYRQIEIILINDGSTDNSLEICKEYASNDERIIILSQKQQGVSIARNNGISAAKGDWITFVDSDDLLDINFCQTTINAALKYQADTVAVNIIFKNEYNQTNRYNYAFTGDIRIFSSPEEINKVFKDTISYINETEGNRNAFTGPYALLSRSNIVKKCFFPEQLHLGEDTCFNLQVLKLVKKVVYINEHLYSYMYVENSLSRKYDEKMYLKVIALDEWVTEFVKKSGDIIEYENCLKAARSVRVKNLIYYYLQTNNFSEFKSRRTVLKRFIKQSKFKYQAKIKLSNNIKQNIVEYLMKINSFCLLWLIFNRRDIKK